MTIEEYYRDGKISQSKLKTFIKSKEQYHYKYVLNNKLDDDTASKGFGRYYHTSILQAHLINENYVLDTGVKVDGMMGTFIEQLNKIGIIDIAFANSGFKESYKNTALKNLEKPESQEYLNFLKECAGKEIISVADAMKADNMKTVLFNNKEAYELLAIGSNSTQMFTEFIIEWNSNVSTLQLKSMLDKVIIDDVKRKITIVDLKTTRCSSMYEFLHDMKKYGYNIQAAFYIDALNYLINNNADWDVYFDYTVDFVFLPQCTEQPYHILQPLRFNNDLLEQARNKYKKALVDLENSMLFSIWTTRDELNTDEEGILTLNQF